METCLLMLQKVNHFDILHFTFFFESTYYPCSEEIAKRLAAAGITGDAAKQMMAAVKGGGRKYFYFVSFGKKLCVLDIAFLLQAIISQFKEFLLVFRYVYVRSCLLPTLEPRLLEAFC